MGPRQVGFVGAYLGGSGASWGGPSTLSCCEWRATSSTKLRELAREVYPPEVAGTSSQVRGMELMPQRALGARLRDWAMPVTAG